MASLKQAPRGSDERPLGSRRRSRGHHRKRHPIRRAVLILFVALLIPLGWSYYHAITSPGSSPLSAKTVEWVKGLPGGRATVLWVERVWYSWHKPPVGGEPSGGIPNESPQPSTSGHPKWQPPHLPAPQDITPIVSNPLPNEGVWHPIGRPIYGVPTMYAAFMRADTVHTSLLAGLVWMDPTLLTGVLVPGTQNPGGAVSPNWGAMVPRSMRDQLAATFNSGFLMADASGGYYSNGKYAKPLVTGDASLVFMKDGTVSVGQWGRDFTMSPNIDQVRQNLSLIVDHSQLVPGLQTTNYQKWGATLGNAVLVWRSGIGVLPNGALVYAAGPGLSVYTLARLLQQAGCVRAMELDINTDWVSFNIYANAPNNPYGVGAQLLLHTMIRSPYRYLVPDERDFVAMFMRPITKPVAGVSPSPTPSSGFGSSGGFP